MRFFSVLLAASFVIIIGAASRAISQEAPAFQQFGTIVPSARNWDFKTDRDGNMHVLLTGNPMLRAETRPEGGHSDHYVLKASGSIDFLLSGPAGAASSAVADGDVRFEVTTTVAGDPPGERKLVVTGDHAVFKSGSKSGTGTVDVTGSPRFVMDDPQLEGPAVLTNGVVFHVDLGTRAFQYRGDETHQPAMTIQPKQITPEPKNGAAPK